MKKQNKHFQDLSQKWTKKHQDLSQSLAQKHTEAFSWLLNNIPAKHHLASASFSGLLFLANPNIASLPLPHAQLPDHVADPDPVGAHMFLIADLAPMLPSSVAPLTPEQEEKISTYLSDKYGFLVKAELNGKRLNRSYGYIGQEQHLARFPGDTLQTHFATAEDASLYSAYGMAPGLGAWGYFVPHDQTVSQEDTLREQYYIAVQTFLAPGFMQNVSEFYEFFKYRKMLVVNPQNGRAIVVVIGDAGPAQWTGKHLGGSPEVMKYLERVDGRGKGPVLYLFIDDPNNTVPLGPATLTHSL